MTTRLPTYSVILTTYNRAHLIHRAVESVLSQTYQNFEFLIIDNGCTDYTQEVLKPYLNDCRVKYLKNPNPTSSCDGPRNFGIELARGVSIAFLDDDDIWYPEKLNTVNQVFVEYPEREIVCHQENIRCGKTIIRQSQYVPWEDNFYERLLYKGNCLSPSATVLKKRIFEQVGVFDLRTSFEGAADYDMWLRIAKAKYKFYFIEDALGEFTITGNNKSNTPTCSNILFFRTVAEGDKQLPLYKSLS